MNKNIHFLPFKKNGLQTRSISHVFQKPKKSSGARCIIFQKDIDVSAMGSSVLDSHGKGRKHEQKF